MAGEIAIKLDASLSNLKAAIIPPDANYGWNGSALVLLSGLTLAQWQAGLVSLAEQVLSTGEHTGLYVGDFPDVGTIGRYGVVVYQGATPIPSDDPIAVAALDWNGREVAYPANLEQLGINASGHVGRVVLVDTCTANTDMRGTDGAYTGTPPSVEQIQSGLATLANQLTVLERLTAARAEYLDKLNVAGDLANTANASSFKADITELATTQNINALTAHGDANWATADTSNLATTTALDALQSHGDATWATAAGFSTLTTADIDARLAAWGKTGFALSPTTGWGGSALPTSFAANNLPAKYPATLAATDVSGDLPANVVQWNSGAIPTVGTSTLTAQQVWQHANRTLTEMGFAVNLTAEARSALVAAIEVELANDETGEALMQAIADKLAADFNLDELTVIAIRDAILNRVLAGNHDIPGSVGSQLQYLNAPIDSRAPASTALSNVTWTDNRAVLLDKLGVPGVLAHTGNADLFKATGFATPADLSGLATASQFSTLQTHGDSNWATAAGFSTLTTADIDARLATWGKSGFSLSATTGWGGTALPTSFAANNLPSKYPATLAATDVSGALPANVVQWNSGALPVIGTSTLTAQQVWQYATRTLTAFSFSVTVGANYDKTGYALTSAYDAAKTASQAGDQMALTASALSSVRSGLSTFNPATDKVYLGNGAHGGAAASLTLSNYSAFKATGFATPSDLAALQTHGDSAWTTATGFATSAEVATSAQLQALQSHGDSFWVTATGFAAPDDFAPILSHLEDIKGTGFVKDTHSLSVLALSPINIHLVDQHLIIR